MKSKKVLMLILIFAMVFSLIACGGGAPASSEGEEGSGDEPAVTESGGEGIRGADIAFIVPSDDALGVNDKGWIQKTWEGVKQFGDENDKTYTWYRPTDNSTQGYLNAMSTAINSGTEVIVSLGFQPVEALAQAQYDYPDTHFISLEGNGIEADIAPNHFAIFHQTDQAGFLAGVAAVKGGFKNIGIINGLDIPPMNIWVWGYIQGINYAAGKEGINDIKVRLTYANTSSASPEVQALAASWYADGLDLIMPMLAGGNNSLFAAADAAGKPCFGADVDQGGESDMVLTSPIKRLDQSTNNALKAIYDGTFPGGTYKWMSVEEDAVALATEHWRVPNYSIEEYEADYQAFKDDVDGVKSGLITQATAPSIDALWEQIKDKHIALDYIK